MIDTVVTELQKDPNRKFMYVEVGFFARWWDQQPAAKQEIARKLVQTIQLEFINGGWCMHDIEAVRMQVWYAGGVFANPATLVISRGDLINHLGMQCTI